MVFTRTFRIIGCLCGILLLAGPAFAQTSRVGPTVTAWGGEGAAAVPTRGSSIAYDPKNDIYLAVSAHGVVRGRFIGSDGTPLGPGPFAVMPSATFQQFPQVAYSPDVGGGAGGFLVTWHESDQSPTSVHARLVTYPSGPVGGDIRIPTSASYWEVGAAVAYSTASQEFLVTWRGFAPADIFAARISVGGSVLGGVITIANSAEFDDHPSVTYSPVFNEFFVVYTGFGSASTLYGRRIQAGSGNPIGGPIPIVSAAAIYITDIAYDPSTNLYAATWYEGSQPATYGRLLNADGSPAGGVTALSTRFKSYDALGIAHNRTSGTFFVVSHDTLTLEDGGVEVDRNGVPVSTGLLVTAAGGSGNFYPKVAAHGSQPDWMVVTSGSFKATLVQRVTTSTRAGAPAPPPPPPPPPPPAASNPRMSIDIPRANAEMASNAVGVAGWALDLGSTSGTGIDAVHVWAWPTNGASPILVGVATLGVARPDVGTAFANARFSASGYTVTGTLPPGAYDLVVSAHSAITGTFNNALAVRVTVTAPQSVPRMAVDLPGMNQNVSRNFTVAGWALDLAAPAGGGVDVVHVWAYPVGGGGPIFVGAAPVGGARPDVAGAFGSARFGTSGFNMTVTGQLAQGTYDLVVYAHSTVTNTFTNAVIVRIRVL